MRKAGATVKCGKTGEAEKRKRKNDDENHEELNEIAGERRLRAAQLAGWRTIRVSVVEADDQAAAVMTTTENLQREDLHCQPGCELRDQSEEVQCG